MTVDTQTPIEKLVRAFAAKDLSQALDCFTEDALFFDPHYPQPQMQGKVAIQEGFQFAFGILKQPGFTVRHLWTADNSGALEVDTNHVFQDGSEAHFPQVFVFETRDNLLTRLQAYVPYPPPAA
jgi:ketosteroid isomerase-like protein